MHYRPAFRFQKTGPAGGCIFDGGEAIAEIRDLRLCNLRLRPGGIIHLGEDVPMPLYWQQYADHENPERNAGSAGEIDCAGTNAGELLLRCSGSNRSGEVLSQFLTRVGHDPDLQSYVLDVDARLEVRSGRHWHITPNPNHGELEFCNFWPSRTFSNKPRGAKRYQACYVQRNRLVTRIPHHHLETSDKHNILMAKGDSFSWLLEDENPVIQIVEGRSISAGLCAYMWDAHFAIRACGDLQERFLSGDTKFTASYRLYSLDRASGKRIRDAAGTADVPELDEIPIYENGVNTFSKTLRSYAEPHYDLWPWEAEQDGAADGAVEFSVDRETGYDDSASLRIDSRQQATGRWLATTLGHAYGQPAFRDGCRYRLSAYVRTQDLEGESTVVLRLHRRGSGSVFRLADYETYASSQGLSGTNGWSRIEVVSPKISPAPDRMHLMLQQSGRGSSWFDNVLFERYV